MKFSGTMKKARKTSGMTQIEFEEKTRVKREYLSKIENGHLKNPTLNFIRKAANGFNISISDLLDGVD